MVSERARRRALAREVLANYRLPGPPRVFGELPGTQLSLRVQAGENRYVLRRFNEYTKASALHGQFLLADFLHRGGLRVLRPLTRERTARMSPQAAGCGVSSFTVKEGRAALTPPRTG
jgi:hypothetical protein